MQTEGNSDSHTALTFISNSLLHEVWKLMQISIMTRRINSISAEIKLMGSFKYQCVSEEHEVRHVVIGQYVDTTEII